MLEKLYLLNIIISSYYPAFKLIEGASLTKYGNGNTANSITTQTEATWQPIIQAHNWLPAPKMVTGSSSLSKTTTDVTFFSQNSEFRNSWKEIHRNNKTHTHHNYTAQTFRNDSYKKITPSIALILTKSTFANPLKTKTQSSHSLNNNSENSIKSDMYPTNFSNQNETVKVQKYQEPSSLIQHTNNRNSLLSVNNLTNLAEYMELTNTSDSITHGHRNNSEAKANIASETAKLVDIIESTKDNILSAIVNLFVINKLSIDNETINVNKSIFSNHYNTTDSHSDIKPLKTKDKNHTAVTTNTSTDEFANTATGEEELFYKETLRKTLQFAKDIFYYISGELSSRKNERSYTNDILNGITEEDDYDIYSNEDLVDDDNDVESLKLFSHKKLGGIPTKIATEKLNSVNMKNTSFSLASTATTSSSLPLQGISEKQNEAIKKGFHPMPINDPGTRAQLLNLPTDDKTITDITSSFMLITPTSKSLTEFSSGRKIKKFKKKFQKFLFPLVLAYKLKFMALIPLLIGGLILLVGSTGLAGFFFALFAAVMSMKTGHGSAVIVKKY